MITMHTPIPAIAIGVNNLTTEIVFDIDLKNIANMNHQDSDMNMRNVFFASLSGGEFLDEVYTATVTRTEELPSGLYRWEQHMDISATHPTPGAELDELKRLALLRGESYKTVESFSTQVLQKTKLYGVDYNLGDTVTVKNSEWGISMHTQLTEMHINSTESGVTHSAVFGAAPINAIQRLRRQIRGG